MPPKQLQRGVSLITAVRKKQEPGSLKKELAEFTQLERKLSTRKLSRKDLEIFAEKQIDYEHMSSKDVQAFKKRFGEKGLSFLPKGYHLSTELGKGVFGTTYQICKNKYRCLAAKFQIVDRKKRHVYEREAEMQKEFAHHGLAPTLISGPDYYVYGKDEKGRQQTIMVLIMDRIDGILDDFLQLKNLNPDHLKKLVSGYFGLLGLMRKYKLTHGDMHPANIAYRFVADSTGVLEPQLLLIDFGYSLSGVAHTELDILQMTKSLLDPQALQNPDEPYPKKVQDAFVQDLFAMLREFGWKDKHLNYEDLSDRYYEMRREVHGLTPK